MKSAAIGYLQRIAGLLGATPEKRKGIMLPAQCRPAELRGYLSAVVIAKDEGRYVMEWLEFHRLMGVEHVYFYDNGSSDETLRVLAPYVKAAYVTWLPWVEFDASQRIQFQAYAHALCNFGPMWRWMAFIDVDEFVFPVKGEDLPSMLCTYEDLPAIAVPWHMFGFSGHERCPAGLVTENFTLRAPFPPPPHSNPEKTLSKWKSIVDPRQIRGVRGAHLFISEERITSAFDENRRYVRGGQVFSDLSSNILRLNHYFTKSKEEFEEKIRRGCVHGKADFGHRVRELADLIEERLVEDTAIHRFLPQLRRAMHKSDELLEEL